MTDKLITAGITPRGIVSYPYFAKAQAMLDEEGKPQGPAKYSGTLIFPAGTDLTEMQTWVHNAGLNMWGPDKFAEYLKKKQIRSPFRDDVEAKNYPAGSIFINCRSQRKPGVVGALAGPGGDRPLKIADELIEKELYPGCIARFAVAAFGYYKAGNRGISFALNHVQKLAEGERLDGRRPVEDTFDVDLSQAPADLSELGL